MQTENIFYVMDKNKLKSFQQFVKANQIIAANKEGMRTRADINRIYPELADPNILTNYKTIVFPKAPPYKDVKKLLGEPITGAYGMMGPLWIIEFGDNTLSVLRYLSRGDEFYAYSVSAPENKSKEVIERLTNILT